MAGINAALKAQQRTPLVLDRQSSYIGVLIDDLITRGVTDPYRMLTSRAEYRLVLRHDNADLRLTPIGYGAGIVSPERWDRFTKKREAILSETEQLNTTYLLPKDNPQIELRGFGAIGESKVALLDLIKRPAMTHATVTQLYSELHPETPLVEPTPEVAEQVEIQTKYAGYIHRQEQQIAQFSRTENVTIPSTLDYFEVSSLSHEAREKLTRIRPDSLGQASRIPGMRPATCRLFSFISRRIGEWPFPSKYIINNEFEAGCEICIASWRMVKPPQGRSKWRPYGSTAFNSH